MGLVSMLGRARGRMSCLTALCNGYRRQDLHRLSFDDKLFGSEILDWVGCHVSSK